MKLNSLLPALGLVGGAGCALAGTYLLFGLAVTLLAGGVVISAFSLWVNT